MIKPSLLKTLLITSLVVITTVFSYGMDAHTGEEIRTRFYQKNGFILSEPLLFTDEKDFPGNDPDLKALSRTSMRDGLIYGSDNTLLDTGDIAATYVLNHDGTLHTISVGKIKGGVHHSFYLKSKPEKVGYGIGKNVACAGTVKVKQGKITNIDNNSGHYRPIEDQFKITMHFLHNKGVLDPSITIGVLLPDYEGGGMKIVSLESILRENPEKILQPYAPAIKRTQGYIEAQREKEKAFQLGMEQLRGQCPQAFLKKPITDLFPNFTTPTTPGKVELGEVTLENRKWRAILNVLGNPIPSKTFAWDDKVMSMPFITHIQNGVVTRRAACLYFLVNSSNYFPFYLIPNENN